jgi:ribosome-associated protein
MILASTISCPEDALAGRPDRSLQLAFTAARIAEENRGRDIVILDMRELTPLFDYFVLATGSSRRQLHAISEEIDNTLENIGDRRLGIEGYVDGRWILLDYGDVVVHLFDGEAREYYSLEQLWCRARRMAWPPEPVKLAQ